MIGRQGASRYDSDGYREGFALECRALRRVRDEMSLTNVIIDETNPAVTRRIQTLVPRAQSAGRPVGLCGRRPSDDPAFTEFLVAGIDSISVAPDSFAAVKQHVAPAELARYGEGRTAPSGTRWPQAEQPSPS
ncbi:putative PEP-binding protein [Streptomyces erythrochromogenes]|uniref:putative PEP-binding protein n=1 Tax=Streptomyces erythrochromogenes TaxID=285574 RepID=UPI00362FCB3B